MPSLVAEIAWRQHGVVARRQLLEIGAGSSTIDRWTRNGHLHQLHRGVYAVGHSRISREARWHAGVLACGAGAVLSFGAAGQSRGIVSPHQRLAIHVTVPHWSGADP
ncbi:MAG TPA: type IV toxin-antitoxin system AbiEi family antitoxin domain-containing protein [Solirubrobacterales bacterium]|nr:type IV toxin-antitoxin system AbiEi family antitoxin domain-containing protein [Solirubrobacterales bacterium]